MLCEASYIYLHMQLFLVRQRKLKPKENDHENDYDDFAGPLCTRRGVGIGERRGLQSFELE